MCSRRLLRSPILIPFRHLASGLGSQSLTILGTAREKHSGFESAVSDSFGRDPIGSAHAIADQLSPAQRAILLSALDRKVAANPSPLTDEAYYTELFKAADTVEPKGVLNREEFEQALSAHVHHSKTVNRGPPSKAAIMMVFVVSAIPFVAFGFLDNSIMIVAGEKIDHLFGAKLGLTTLASAGLGNLIADVTGVGAAGFIEEGVKKIPYIKPPPLSSAQVAMRSVRAAKFYGSLVGVAIGCLLGLTPLLAMGHFFVTPHV